MHIFVPATTEQASRATSPHRTAKCLFVLPLLTVAALGLWQVTLLAWAWLVLSQAANAGAIEASLPRAGRASIEAAVDRALIGRSIAKERGPIEIAINEWPSGDIAIPCAVSGDRMCVRVRLRAAAVAPDFLRCVGLSLADDMLSATAVVRKP